MSKHDRQTDRVHELTAVSVEPTAPYGDVSLSWPKTEAVYEGRFNKAERSTKAILYSVPFNGTGGIAAEGAVYGRLVPTNDGHEITFGAALPKGFSGPKEATDALLAHIERAALAWNGFDKATEAAQNRLCGIKAPASTDKAVRPDMRPRLVKAVQVAQSATQTVQ